MYICIFLYIFCILFYFVFVFLFFSFADVGFSVPDHFVVGYATDYNEYFRDLSVCYFYFYPTLYCQDIEMVPWGGNVPDLFVNSAAI